MQAARQYRLTAGMQADSALIQLLQTFVSLEMLTRNPIPLFRLVDMQRSSISPSCNMFCSTADDVSGLYSQSS